MKLKTYLKKLDNDKIISIGAEDGSSYVYIGNANVDLIHNVFEDYRKWIKELIPMADKELKDLILNPPVIGVMEKKANVKNVRKHAIRVKTVIQRIDNYEKYLGWYVDPLEREIVCIEDRCAEDGIRVIIKGSEKGDFWFKSEFDKKYC